MLPVEKSSEFKSGEYGGQSAKSGIPLAGFSGAGWR
jgi:hypothetical protein